MQSKKIFNLIFVSVLGICLLLGLAFILIAPMDVNEYENRFAEKIADFSINNVSESVFQNSIELTAADQLPFAVRAKETYNKVFSAYSKLCIDKLIASEEKHQEKEKTQQAKEKNTTQGAMEQITGSAVENTTLAAIVDTTSAAVETTSAAIENETSSAIATQTDTPATNPDSNKTVDNDKYIGLGNGLTLHSGYLLQGFTSLKGLSERGNGFIENLNGLIEKYPEYNFYCYYIEKESDVYFQTGARSGFYEYLKERINLPDNSMSRLYVENFDDYAKYFYRTDHHWAYKGSYQGYKDILAMMKPDETPLEPLDELKIGIQKGSLANKDNTSSYSEEFYAYEFNFPEMTITSEGKTIGYGNQASYISKARNGNNGQSIAYWSFYGADVGEAIFHNPAGSGTLLMFGNSYDNAVLKLLASHYEYVYSIDLRYYKNITGKNFSFAEYVATHQIDDVLTMGSSTYFVQTPFRIPE